MLDRATRLRRAGPSTCCGMGVVTARANVDTARRARGVAGLRRAPRRSTTSPVCAVERRQYVASHDHGEEGQASIEGDPQDDQEVDAQVHVEVRDAERAEDREA